jgi:hypothetical protein
MQGKVSRISKRWADVEGLLEWGTVDRCKKQRVQPVSLQRDMDPKHDRVFEGLAGPWTTA